MSGFTDLEDMIDEIFIGPLSTDEEPGRLILIYGPPSTRKTEFTLRIALEAAKRGAVAHYFDVNLSLSPHMFITLSEEEREVPLRIYRPRGFREAERSLEYMCLRPQTPYPQVIVLNSLIIRRRVIALRDLQFDPLYLISLLKRSTSTPKKLALMVVETNAQEPTNISFFGGMRDLLDLAVRLNPLKEGSTLVSLYDPPFETLTHSLRVANSSFSFT